MKKEEMIKAVSMIVANYPNLQSKNTAIIVELWYSIFKDVSWELFQKAILNIIATDAYPPNAARIKNELLDLTRPKLPEAIEAWAEVERAVQEFGAWKEEEGLNSLSPITRKVAVAIGWRNICLSENIDVVRGQFLRVYDILKHRAEVDEALIYKRPEPEKLPLDLTKFFQEHKIAKEEKK